MKRRIHFDAARHADDDDMLALLKAAARRAAHSKRATLR